MTDASFQAETTAKAAESGANATENFLERSRAAFDGVVVDKSLDGLARHRSSIPFFKGVPGLALRRPSHGFGRARGAVPRR